LGGEAMSRLNAPMALKLKYEEYLMKALQHLEYSVVKSKNLPTVLSENTEESLEAWEGLTARFARVVDIFLTKYLKLIVRLEDPIFDGTLRDYLNVAEKARLLTDVDHWLSLRELRNIQAHDYTNEAFEKFVLAVKSESEFILRELEKMGLYAAH
jgi:hypothetical protein